MATIYFSTGFHYSVSRSMKKIGDWFSTKWTFIHAISWIQMCGNDASSIVFDKHWTDIYYTLHWEYRGWMSNSYNPA